MKINKKLMKNINYRLVLSTIAISIIGIISIWCAIITSTKIPIMQAVWFIIALIVSFVIINIDYNTIGGYYRVIYLFSVFLLILVLIIGKGDDKGSKSWLGIGPFGGQPSEFAKLATIIALAKLMEGMENINKWKNLFKIAVVALIPMLLIQKQPDTGTNVMFAATVFGMLFVAGLDLKIIFGTIGTMAVAAVAVWNMDILQNYQRHRIMVFFKPELDLFGKGYNAYMAKCAIGAGNFFGMGFKNGYLSSGDFIPEKQTDFIFSIFAESFGFLGSTLLLFLYFIIIYESVKIARESKDKFGMYLVSGVISLITFQVFQNIGMDIGLMPVTGIPLPFMSYGGSALMAYTMAIAMVVNVGMRKEKINF